MIQLILFTFLLSLTTAYPDECIDTRAAFEIGTVNMKVKVAKVNTCSNRIEVVLYQETFNFSMEEPLTEGRQKIAIAELLDFKKKAAKFKPSIYVGKSSYLLGEIPFGHSFLQKIKNSTQLDFSLMDLKNMALLALYSITQETGLPPENLVVWDIGGFQTRIISKEPDGNHLTYLGKSGSIQFKNQVLHKIKKQDPKKFKSPNPINKDTFKKALALAKKWALEVDPKLRKKMVSPKVKVVGIGGVHYSAVRPLANPRSKIFSRAEVLSAIQKNLGKTDKQLKGLFRESQITNLILVLGYMQAFNLDIVETSEVDLINGVLINPNLNF